MILALWMGLIGISAAESGQAITEVAEQLRAAPFASVRVEGFLGQRIDRNIRGRLKHVPMGQLLGGFRNRPGSHPWIGEHIGKWIHAAVCAWQYSNDQELKAMLDRAVAVLLAAQKRDGYLGTYEDKKRWTSWDVWVHKYNLIGLLAYHRVTGDEAALKGARRIGNLLTNTFGPDRRDIIKAGPHVGMAATCVLEPMVYLYRATGDKRYLSFCGYLVESWDQPNGPKILSGLLSHGKVNELPSGKAYELLSNLVGLTELYRVTGTPSYLKAAQAGWADVVRHQLRITGGSSWREVFWPDGYLPDEDAVAETCVNVTWMQLSMRLLALTGEPQYADAIEQVIYNHLLGAQAEDGNDWCVYTPLAGIKFWQKNVNCCHSSGPRGVALIPAAFYSTSDRRLRVNLYGPSQFNGEVPGVGLVELVQRTSYPVEGRIDIDVKPAQVASFRLELRIPSWSRNSRLTLNGQPIDVANQSCIVLDRQWQPGDTITLLLDAAPQWVPGTGDHAGKLTARKGPLVLCAATRWNPDLVSGRLMGVEEAMVLGDPGEVPETLRAEKGFLASVRAKMLTPDGVEDKPILLGPYALVQDAKFWVWLPTVEALSKVNRSSLVFGREGRSRLGYVYGSLKSGDFNDGNPKTYHVTHDEAMQDRDWWEVAMDEPVTIQRVVFMHGHVFEHGGWFDTSAGKPEVLVRTQKEGSWTKVGELTTYPDTTSDQQPSLIDGQSFETEVAPVKVYGVRVAGKPASGNKPSQAFSSCAELCAEGPYEPTQIE